MAPVLQALLPGRVEGTRSECDANCERRQRGLGFLQAPADLCLAEDPHTHRVQGALALKSSSQSKLLVRKLGFATESTLQFPKLFEMQREQPSPQCLTQMISVCFVPSLDESL